MEHTGEASVQQLVCRRGQCPSEAKVHQSLQFWVAKVSSDVDCVFPVGQGARRAAAVLGEKLLRHRAATSQYSPVDPKHIAST